MCSDQMNLGADVDKLAALGVDWLHLDIMDAHFVPNITLGSQTVKALQQYTSLPLDIHLMVDDPELMLERFPLRSGDIVSPHVELDRDFAGLAARVHGAGCMFGLALNPETPVEALEPHLGIFDTVTLMLVHPGFSGARMVDGIMEKVGETRRYLDSKGLGEVMISIDGAISPEKAEYMSRLGAQIFVGGSAGIYRNGMRLEETIPAFRKSITIK